MTYMTSMCANLSMKNYRYKEKAGSLVITSKH